MSDFRHLIAKAIRLKGSQQKLAEAAGCSQQQISYLMKDAAGISAEMALRIERATDGAVTRHELRPDIYGPAPQPTPTSEVA